jgi:predicted aldo/keto reductase-like oxidoreductase
MEKNRVRLGKTEILVDKNGFGALPIQRISDEEAVKLLRKAYDNGITYFDTARAYTDSEHKIGLALADVREQIYIATKSMGYTGEALKADLETSLQQLETDYIDVYQTHNPPFCPKPGGEDGVYDALLEAKAAGKIRHIGITSHRLQVAREAIGSGLYETLQFPLNYLSTDQEVELVKMCEEADMGFIAMKGMSGGLINDGRAAYAYLNQFPTVLPIWGVQKEEELDQFLDCRKHEPSMEDEAVKKVIDGDRAELQGEFCRGCGYCMPCPSGIVINNCARMFLLMRRGPAAPWLTEEWQERMGQIDQCTGCGLCKSKCPYELDIPNLLKKNLEDYRQILKGFA